MRANPVAIARVRRPPQRLRLEARRRPLEASHALARVEPEAHPRLTGRRASPVHPSVFGRRPFRWTADRHSLAKPHVAKPPVAKPHFCASLREGATCEVWLNA